MRKVEKLVTWGGPKNHFNSDTSIRIQLKGLYDLQTGN